MYKDKENNYLNVFLRNIKTFTKLFLHIRSIFIIKKISFQQNFFTNLKELSIFCRQCMKSPVFNNNNNNIVTVI